MATNLCNNLKITGERLYWDSTVSNLKEFVSNELGISGKWSSPGGEVKLLTSDSVSLKWHGKTAKWITLSGDPEKTNNLSEVLTNLCELSAEKLVNDAEVCHGFPIESEPENPVNFVPENSVCSVNESTQVSNSETNVLDSNDLLPVNILKSVNIRFSQTEGLFI
jgi:hypothetical protein